MLTVDKMDTFCQGIAICDLPEVFRDAIHVARELGLSYIWIDALCIIQHGDDGQDWLRESALMRSVYGNCHVNIAATSASNVHKGLFSKLEHYSGGFYARVTTAKFCTAQCFFHSYVHSAASTDTHLATRAWTFQERLLPARTIFLGDTGIFWECRSSTRSEFLPQSFPWVTDRTRLVRPENEGWNWQHIVGEYSRANLTNPRDRLPALAGIARRQYEATGHHYLAGMWKEHLAHQLLWTVAGKRRQRPSWRAPTWSWASVDGGAYYRTYWYHDTFLREAKHYVQVLDVWTTSVGPDPFGQVSNGLLSLACSALMHAPAS
ncbi:heterokaryon incompatibility protein [Colletotrichum sojae]|uniref:Heterokaryon incompatibility protein n=1 Tax=Colletotrichum sojae TaxID=2175907 RepID=A0A8H6IPI9_9PEZI|nr:heterokaryon incompatibility protein [Colletotrichum sojae]